MSLLTYVGQEAEKLLGKKDLTELSTEAAAIQKVGDNQLLSFIKGVPQRVEAELAKLIAHHPTLAADFKLEEEDVDADEAATPSPAAGSASSSGTSTPGVATSTSGVSSEPSTPSA